MLDESVVGEVMQLEQPPISAEVIRAFVGATRSRYATGIPPTLATIYRDLEYKFLERMKADLRYLLHGEQEYEYMSPLRANESFLVRAKIADLKERKGKEATLNFIVMESEIVFGGKISVRSRTNFVIRQPSKERP